MAAYGRHIRTCDTKQAPLSSCRSRILIQLAADVDGGALEFISRLPNTDEEAFRHGVVTQDRVLY